MIYRAVAWTVVCGLLSETPVLCQTPDVMAVEDEALLAFVQLGNFSDRGIVGQIITSTFPKGQAEVNMETEDSVPRELLEFLKMRENNLSKETKLRWIITTEDHSIKATIDRFKKHGLIELFNNENTKLLDSPLTQRKELIRRLNETEDQVSKTLAATYSKELPKARLIVIAGHLRSLSVELDLEILKSLSPDERVRIGKLFSHLLPKAVAESRQWNRRFELGSAFLDTKVGEPMNSK